MPYRFRLQTVLSYKQRLEESRQLELGRLQRAHLEQQRLLAVMQTEKTRLQDELRRRQTVAPVDLAAVVQGFVSLERLEQEMRRQIARINELAQQVEQARQSLVEAMQERKVYEKLRERGEQQYREEERAAETRTIDDIVTTRFRRSQ